MLTDFPDFVFAGFLTTDPPPEWEGFLLTDFPDFVFADFIDFPTDPMQEAMKTTCAQVLNKQASK